VLPSHNSSSCFWEKKKTIILGSENWDTYARLHAALVNKKQLSSQAGGSKERRPGQMHEGPGSGVFFKGRTGVWGGGPQNPEGLVRCLKGLFPNLSLVQNKSILMIFDWFKNIPQNPFLLQNAEVPQEKKLTYVVNGLDKNIFLKF
jgi:hypothetical protein